MVSSAFADVNEHFELIKARLDWLLRIDKIFWSGVQFSTTIQNGLSESVSKEVFARTFRIGSALDGNIVLLDDGVEDEHSVMSLKSSVFGPIMSVRALAGDVEVDGVPLAIGTSSGFRALPQTISVAGIEILVDGSEVPGQRRREIVNHISKVALSIVLFAAILLFSFQFVNQPRFSFDLGLGYTEAWNNEGDVPPRLSEVIERVNAELDRLGLSSSLSAEVRETGSLAITGTLMADRVVDWRKFQLWYDQNEEPVLLSGVTLAPSLNDVPPIASFGLIEPKYVRLSTGRLVRVGDELHSGLTLVDVEEDAIVLRRSDNDAVISIPTGFDTDG